MSADQRLQLLEARARRAAVHAEELLASESAPPPTLRSRLRPLLPPACVLAALLAAALTAPDNSSFAAFRRARALRGRASGSVDNYLLFSLASHSGASFVGAFGRWAQLPDAVARVGSDAAPLVLALNCTVWLLFQLAPAGFMYRHFTVSSFRAAALRPWSLLGAAFSHQSVLHLASNAWSLLSVVPPLQSRLGPLRLLQLYCACGLASSLASITLNALRGRQATSCGASGALYGLLSAVAVLSPRTRFTYFGGARLSGWQLIAAQIVVQAALGGGVDVGGHAGGAAFGAAAAIAWNRRGSPLFRQLARWWLR